MATRLATAVKVVRNRISSAPSSCEAQRARIFLLDEPFTGLDRPSQENLARTMRGLAAAGNLVIASHHDLKNVQDFFDQMIFLNGELIAHGDSASVFTEENLERTFNTEVFSGAREPEHHHHHA